MPGTRPLTDSEQTAITSALAEFSPRDAALVTVMLQCGYRISEMLALNVCDVWAAGEIRPRVRLSPASLKGGTGKYRRSVTSRTVVLNESATAILRSYLFALFGSAGPAIPSRPLFVSRKGGRLSRWAANKIIHRVIAAAGIRGQSRGELSSHALRKTFCTNVYNVSGHDINLTRAVMNHKHVTTTQCYLHVRQDDAERAVLAIGNRSQPIEGALLNTSGQMFGQA